MAANSTGTTTSTLFPSITFASVKNDLGTIDVAIPDTVKIYIVDPIEITSDYFRKAFYANSGDLKYFKPSDTTITDLTDIAILKNLLFLNSGGGNFTHPDTNVVTPLVKKTITFNGGSPEEFVINSFIIADVESAAGDKPYETWSVDSQIDLSRKLSNYNYIYDFPIVLTGDTKNTNALTWNQLKKAVNIFIYKYYNETGSTLPNNNIVPVILNFVVSFKTLVGLGVGVDPEETTTQVLYQYKITNWLFETIESN